ncbi:MAG TPA: hypothetical protein VE954_22145 [Oligoflexus sp.]|uniref:hypothetical protein n=1 Tax=Oligoflexus sp. TaxID=1971216 RepID=UPI002D59F9B9|nr:hypothetical protein [Oligoflexus sp.]HYX35809.1 hypothetical protein [Oligoflexus sp.]
MSDPAEDAPKKMESRADAATATEHISSNTDPIILRDAEGSSGTGFIDLTTPYGMRLWIQRSAVVAVQEAGSERFMKAAVEGPSEPMAMVHTTVGEWKVVRAAADLVKALES